MKCYICDQENWHSMAHMNPERELQVCKTCGNVAYKVDPADEAKVLDYYRFKYRPSPTVNNLITSSHKQNYVTMFLADFLKDKKGLVCGDVGSAIGYIPNVLRLAGHKTYGCELTVTYRRFCEHFYGIPLAEELPEQQYDLITVYHVLEHLIEPDKKLAKYASMLKDDGRMMISTPEWFDTLEESSGLPMKNFQHLFHKDHINVFSKQSIQNLFAKCGLVIEKEDHTTYGQTYFLRKAAAGDRPQSHNFFVVEPFEQQVEKIEKCNRAIELWRKGNAEYQQRHEGGASYLDAIEVWPRFPDAWISLIFQVHMKNREKQEQLIAEAFKALPDNARLHLSYALWLYQGDRYEDAIKEFEWIMAHRPIEDAAQHIGFCYAALGKHRESIEWSSRACNMNPMRWAESYNWICREAVQMPAWDERAAAELKEKLFAEAAPKFEQPV